MVATYAKKIKHSMPCVTGVYLRDITNMIFIILHLNMSCLSVCFCSLSLNGFKCQSESHFPLGKLAKKGSKTLTEKKKRKKKG